MLKNNKGISLITAIMTVLVMIILLATITYAAQKNIKVKKINQLYSDLRELTDAIQIYYIKHAKLPVTKEKYIVSSESIKKINEDDSEKSYKSIQEADLEFILGTGDVFSYENLYNPNDYDIDGDYAKAVYSIIDLTLLDNITLNYNGTYLINEKSKTVYFYDGVEIEDDKYHRLPLKYIDIPYDVKENGSLIEISDIYLPVYRSESTTLNLKNFFVVDKEPRLIEFFMDESSLDYFSVDTENGTISSIKSENDVLILPSTLVGSVDAYVYSYGVSDVFEFNTDVYVTEVYLEERNNIITNIEDEITEIYLPINGKKTILANKNGAAGNLSFSINNNCDTQSTEVSYTVDQEDTVTTLDDNTQKIFKNLYIEAGTETGKAILTVIETNGNAYKNLNINIIKPELVISDTVMVPTKTTIREDDEVLVENNSEIVIANTTTSRDIKLTGLEDIDWGAVGNSITWVLEMNTEKTNEDGVVATDIVELTQENENVTLKARGVDGNINLKCKISISGNVIKEIIQPINVTITE